ncbi:MAG: FAD-binding protein [Planctomycetes bacterium]|nr:FAD-binding protein [Planctomycetota bacterium]
MPFNPLRPAWIAELRSFVDEKGSFVSREDMEKYASDETEDLVYWPELVLRPTTAEQVSAILRFCNERGVPVTPRGAGTGLSGGALAVHGGVCLTLERMNRILEIDAENLMAVVEPGVITEVFQNEVEKLGLFYPPDPASRGSCMLGGNVAHGAGGPRAVKYGVTKDYVYGLQLVLPTGEILSTGGKLIKNVTGYNLSQLLVGSEGTLAVVTRIVVKLLPLPRFTRLVLAPFDSPEACAKTITSFFEQKIIPTALEYLERAAVEAAERRLGRKYPVPACAALLLVALDGNNAGQLDRDLERVGELCLAGGAADVFLADTAEKQREIWSLRRATGEAVKSISIYKEEDTVVPRSRLPELVRLIAEVTKKYGITAISYGHAGDGNLHCNILKMNMSDERWEKDLPVAISEIFRGVVALGGTISGEHGVGFVQRAYVPIAKSEAELALLRRIKAAFDPNGILNPGKIF